MNYLGKMRGYSQFFNDTCQDLHLLHNHKPGKNTFELVGTVFKALFLNDIFFVPSLDLEHKFDCGFLKVQIIGNY